MAFQIIGAVLLVLAPFIIIYAKEDLGITGGQVSFATILFMGSTALSSYFIGRLGDRYGYKLISILQAFLLACFFFIALIANTFVLVCVGYVFYSIAFISQLFLLYNMSLELCPNMKATELAAFGRILPLPFVVVASPLCGLIIDISHTYFWVFLLGVFLSVVMLLGRLFLVSEPRRSGNSV